MIQPSQIDPRIATHLEPGEQVLWQGTPRRDTFFGTPQIATSAGLAVVGGALAAGLLDNVFPALASATGAARYVPALAAFGASALILNNNWSRRGVLWAYAITDRRLLSVLNRRLIRSVTPAQFDAVKLDISGDTVYWARSPRNADDRTVIEGMRKGPDHPLIGFHGQEDPHALRDRILAWRRSLTDRASAGATEFLAERTVAVDRAPQVAPDQATHAPPSEEITARPQGQYRHGPSGVCVDLPVSWKVTVQTRTQKSLRLLGAKFLPSMFTDSEPASYTGEQGWNLLRASPAPDVSFELYIREGILERSLQSVVEDPMNSFAGLKLLDQVPDLKLPNGYSGFSLRRMSAGGEGKGDTVLQQAWISNSSYVIEAQGNAPADRPELVAALNMIFSSITS